MKVKEKAFFLWLLLISYTVILVGCDKESVSNKEEKKSREPMSVLPTPKLEENLPINLGEGEFEKVYGWLDSNRILYTTIVGFGSNVYSYNLVDGSNQLLFKSEYKIDSVHISHSREHVFIRASPTMDESIINVINKDGRNLYTERLSAVDLTLEWNPYNDNQLLISTFTEDWQAESYLLSLKEKQLIKMNLPNPFSNWITEEKVSYLDWDQEKASLFSNLLEFNIKTNESNEIQSNVYQSDTFKERLLTITIDSDNQKGAVYNFYQKNQETVGSFKTPILTRFSDWLIPYYDYNEYNDHFLTFQPLYNGEAEVYKEGFQLTAFDISKNKETVLMEGLDNEPLSCSPNGTMCLYGYYFEKLILLDSEKMIQLISE
jgi:hypothetical protein